MLAQLVFRQLVEHFSQSIVANCTESTWGDFESAFLVVDEASLFQHLGHFGQLL